MARFIWFCVILIFVILVARKRGNSFAQKPISDRIQTEFDEKVVEYVTSHMQTVQNTYYDVLGVPSGASQAQISSAYKKLVKKYHPDHNPDKDAAEQFMKIMDAYEVLRTKEKRAEYDKLLLQKYKRIFIINASVQNLRHTIADMLKISPKAIKFTQTGDVFINDVSANCWCSTGGFFVYYEPIISEHKKFSHATYEVIVLTSYTTVELKQMMTEAF